MLVCLVAQPLTRLTFVRYAGVNSPLSARSIPLRPVKPIPGTALRATCDQLLRTDHHPSRGPHCPLPQLKPACLSSWPRRRTVLVGMANQRSAQSAWRTMRLGRLWPASSACASSTVTALWTGLIGRRNALCINYPRYAWIWPVSNF